MGILDEAIREHLELKRSHGAPDDEIRQKEAEAFGPIRQDAAPVAADAVAAAADHDVPVDLGEATQIHEPAGLDPLEPAAEDPYVVHPGDHVVPDESAPAAAEAGAGLLEPSEVETGPPIAPRDHHHEDEPHPALVDHDHIGGEEHAPEPVFRQEAPPLDPAPVDDPPVGDPPVQRPDIDEPPPRQSPEPASEHEVGPIAGPPEDPLEETPEFLQDAPEHDRLWFEQKPPRDFDFGD